MFYEMFIRRKYFKNNKMFRVIKIYIGRSIFIFRLEILLMILLTKTLKFVKRFSWSVVTQDINAHISTNVRSMLSSADQT